MGADKMLDGVTFGHTRAARETENLEYPLQPDLVRMLAMCAGVSPVRDGLPPVGTRQVMVDLLAQLVPASESDNLHLRLEEVSQRRLPVGYLKCAAAGGFE
jgi:hypothetical protein